MARGDINLTVAVNEKIEGIDAAARKIHDDLNNASGAAGKTSADRFGDAFSKGLADQDGKIARGFDRSVDAISRVTELTEKLDQQRRLTAETTKTLADAERDLDRIRKDGTATAEELAAAEERRRVAFVENNKEMQRQITMQNSLNRATKSYASSLGSIARAQQQAADDSGAGQGLLTAGKYISAIRSVAVPGTILAVASMGAQVLAAASIASQALWLIPGAAAAGAAGIGTLSLATMGFGDAIKDIGDPEKFAEAIQNLSPNAQQAALAIQAIMEPLKALKNSVQDALFANFGPMINELANQYLPMIKQFATSVASAFNAAGTGLFDELMKPETQLMIRQTLATISQGFANLAPALAPFSRAIMDIINVGASFLPELGASATRAAQSFADFISEARASGQLAQWLRDGMDAVGMLWQGVKALGGAFADLAPIGKEILPGMVAGINLIAQAIPPVVGALTEISPPIGEAAQAIQSFEKVFTPIMQKMNLDVVGLGESFNWVKTTIDAVKQGIQDFVTSLIPFGNVINILAKLRGIDTSQTLPGLTAPNNLDLANRYAAADRAAGGGGGSFGPGGMLPGFYRTRDGRMRPRPMTDPISAGLPGFPAGGYAVPAPPPEKGSGGKAAEVPFSADPSLWSVDAIPVAPSGLTAANSQMDTLAMIAAGYGLVNTSDVRSPTPSDPKSFHHSGQAVDFAGTPEQMHAFAMDMAQTYGGMIEELIYSDPVRGDVLIGGGQDVRGTGYYDAATLAQHQNHVHLAVKDAMAPFINSSLGGMPAAMGSGGYMVDPEAVMRAENAMITAKNDVEQKRLRLLELEAKGNASQLELLTAKNNVAEAENKYREAELNLAQARQGKYKEFDSKMKGVAQGISDIGAALADDFGLSEGLPGMAKWLTTFLANLAFAPMMGKLAAISAANPIQGGHGMLGMMGAQAMANGTYPSFSGMGGMSAPVMSGTPGMAGIGPTPTPALPGPMVTPMTPGGPIGLGPTPGPAAVPTASAIGPRPIGGGIGSGAMMPGMAPPPASLPTAQTSQAPQAASPGGGFQGLGGLPMEAAMTATAGLDLLAPGASQAAQMGIKLANRTIAYGGQLAAIGVGGLMETFLPNNSPLADPSKSWLGKIAAGIAGASPALPNTAGGQTAPAQTPVPQQQQGQPSGPMVNIENINNQTPDGGQTLGNQLYRSYMAGMGR